MRKGGRRGEGRGGGGEEGDRPLLVGKKLMLRLH